jgi:hypothetical protein
VFKVGSGWLGQFAFTRISHRFAATLLITFFLITSGVAQSLVTISCNQPKGYSMQYGISPWDRLDAAVAKRPEPKQPKFTGPTDDSFIERPTFILMWLKESSPSPGTLTATSRCRRRTWPMNSK